MLRERPSSIDSNYRGGIDRYLRLHRCALGFFGLMLMLVSTRVSVAQSPTETVVGPTQATKVPLSGKQMPEDTVTLTQRTAEGSPANSVNVIDSTGWYRERMQVALREPRSKRA